MWWARDDSNFEPNDYQLLASEMPKVAELYRRTLRNVAKNVAKSAFQPWFLGINPRGLVPVLVDDGAVHIEMVASSLPHPFSQPEL